MRWGSSSLELFHQESEAIEMLHHQGRKVLLACEGSKVLADTVL